MIYLFDRLYLASDHYIRNDKDQMTVLLGPSAVEARKCKTLAFDFGKIKLDDQVDNDQLHNYFHKLINDANGSRVVVYTDDCTLIKILAYYCASVFKNPTAAFVKELVLIDKLWIDMAPGLINLDFSYRHKGYDQLDTSKIDQCIAEGMSIMPRLTNLPDIRLEYAFAGYLNGSLAESQKTVLENKLMQIFCRTFWLGDDIETYAPCYLTLAHKKGLDLDNFTLPDLKQKLSTYSKIFDIAINGDAECFAKTSVQDHLDFINQADQDFDCITYPQDIRSVYVDFYNNKKEFIKQHILTPENSDQYYAAFNRYNLVKTNPYLWYSIAGSHDNKNHIDKFWLNV